MQVEDASLSAYLKILRKRIGTDRKLTLLLLILDTKFSGTTKVSTEVKYVDSNHLKIKP